MWYVFADEEVIVLHSKGLNWLIDFQPGSNFVAAPLNRGSRGDSYIESSSYFIPLLTTWSKNILQGVRMQNVMFWIASLVWSWAVKIYAWTTIWNFFDLRQPQQTWIKNVKIQRCFCSIFVILICLWFWGYMTQNILGITVDFWYHQYFLFFGFTKFFYIFEKGIFVFFHQSFLEL